MTVKRLALVLVYANTHQRPFALHADLIRPTQYERDCAWAAWRSRGYPVAEETQPPLSPDREKA